MRIKTEGASTINTGFPSPVKRHTFPNPTGDLVRALKKEIVGRSYSYKVSRLDKHTAVALSTGDASRVRENLIKLGYSFTPATETPVAGPVVAWIKDTFDYVFLVINEEIFLTDGDSFFVMKKRN